MNDEGVGVPLCRPVAVTLPDLLDFATCADLFALRKDYAEQKALEAVAVMLHNEAAVVAMDAGLWP